MKDEIMKKLTTFVLFFALFAILSACEGKKAVPIKLPDAPDIESVKITRDNQTSEKTDSEWIFKLVEQAATGKSTTRDSIQDVPNIAEYIKIDFVLKDGNINTLFIYQEISEWYIEQPYQGIYLANEALIEIIDNAD